MKSIVLLLAATLCRCAVTGEIQACTTQDMDVYKCNFVQTFSELTMIAQKSNNLPQIYECIQQINILQEEINKLQSLSDSAPETEKNLYEDEYATKVCKLSANENTLYYTIKETGMDVFCTIVEAMNKFLDAGESLLTKREGMTLNEIEMLFKMQTIM